MTHPETSADSIPEAGLAYETPQRFRPRLAITLGMVGLKLIGFYFLMTAAAAIPQVVYYFIVMSSSAAAIPQRLTGMSFLIMPLFNAGLGWWLFAKGGRLAVRLFASVPDSSSVAAAINLQQIATLFVAAVGLFTITTSIPQLSNAAYSLMTGQYRVMLPYVNAGRSMSTALFDTSTAGFLLSLLVQPAAGFYLLLRADRVTRLFSKYTITSN